MGLLTALHKHANSGYRGINISMLLFSILLYSPGTPYEKSMPIGVHGSPPHLIKESR